MNENLLFGALGVGIIGLAIAIARQRIPGGAVAPVEPDTEWPDISDLPDFTPSAFASVSSVLSPLAPGDNNVSAFLDMIAYAEGTAGINGYRTLFGGSLFASFADHPRLYFDFTNTRGESLKTSAAGRYQFIVPTWDKCQKRLGLVDFGPASQDAAAIELIREKGALEDVKAGRFAVAVKKCAPVWASLPGAGYAQPERKLSQLVTAYQQAGGQILA